MQPGQYDFTIYQGATLSKVLTWKDSSGTVINLTGYTAAMQIRDEHGALVLDVGLLSGGLVINGTAGTVTITIPGVTTTTLGFDSAKYDLKLTSAAATRLLEGTVLLSKQVTQ